MADEEFSNQEVGLRLGIIIQKIYYRYTVDTKAVLCKNLSLPLLFFKFQEDLDLRLEVHPNSIEEILQLEGQPIYYLILNKRPSVSRKEANKDFWNPEILEFSNEDPFVQLIFLHFLVIKVSFDRLPMEFLKYLYNMKIKVDLGYFEDMKPEVYPIPLGKML